MNLEFNTIVMSHYLIKCILVAVDVIFTFVFLPFSEVFTTCPFFSEGI